MSHRSAMSQPRSKSSTASSPSNITRPQSSMRRNGSGIVAATGNHLGAESATNHHVVRCGRRRANRLLDEVERVGPWRDFGYVGIGGDDIDGGGVVALPPRSLEVVRWHRKPIFHVRKILMPIADIGEHKTAFLGFDPHAAKLHRAFGE